MAKITKYLEIILDGGDLTFDQAKDLQDVIFAGEVTEVQIAAFLAAMRMKRATSGEIAGLAQSLRDHAVRVENVQRIDGRRARGRRRRGLCGQAWKSWHYK